MDYKTFRRNIVSMTELFEPVKLEEEIKNLPASSCQVCKKGIENNELIKCFFCCVSFCNSCSGKQGTRICLMCNFNLATYINEDILKQFSVSELKIMTKNYNIPLDYVLEKEHLIEAILINFRKSIKPSNEIVQVIELKKKMDDLKVEESFQREKNRLEDENRSKIFADYSNITFQNDDLFIDFSPEDAIYFEEIEIANLSVSNGKEILNRFNVNYSGITEKKELFSLVENVNQKFKEFKNSHINKIEKPKTNIKLECNICKVGFINCVFLFCGDAMCCFQCGSKLSKCPNCHDDIKQCFKINIG